MEKIKKLAVTAMFSDDDLMDQLVLKGGNAMALIHKLTSRESVDIDFSMSHDFQDGAQAAYFSDRGRLFQADRGRRIGVAVAALGKRAGTGVNVS